MERQMIERHFRQLSQHARLKEFAFSESGAMSAQKAAQMGAVLATSALAGLLMSAGMAEAACTPCMVPEDCGGTGFSFCRNIHCGVCGHYYCTNGVDDPTC